MFSCFLKLVMLTPKPACSGTELSSNLASATAIFSHSILVLLLVSQPILFRIPECAVADGGIYALYLQFLG